MTPRTAIKAGTSAPSLTCGDRGSWWQRVSWKGRRAGSLSWDKVSVVHLPSCCPHVAPWLSAWTALVPTLSHFPPGDGLSPGKRFWLELRRWLGKRTLLWHSRPLLPLPFLLVGHSMEGGLRIWNLPALLPPWLVIFVLATFTWAF